MSGAATKRKSDLVDKVKRALRSHELGVKHYARADALAKEIALEIEPGQSVKIGDKKVTLVDEYQTEKDIIWRPCGFRRWSLKVEPV